MAPTGHLILAENAIEANGKLYVHGGSFTGFVGPRLPFSAGVTIVTIFRSDPQTSYSGIWGLSLRSPGGSVSMLAEGTLQMDPQASDVEINQQLMVLPTIVEFREAGVHEITFTFEATSLDSVLLSIRVQPGEQE